MDRGSEREDPATPDEIRARIRSEHAAISAQLARVEALTERIGAEDRESVIALREELQVLGKILLEHLHYEEYQLPSLAGKSEVAQMVEDMHEEHRSQREIFDSVIRELDETAVGSKLVVGVRELSRAIRDDMEHEERELLNIP
jgi:iron-sulfur cluster repair protein YtfE (RIC family)